MEVRIENKIQHGIGSEVKGEDVKNLTPGTILRCKRHVADSNLDKEAANKMVVVTSDKDHPLVTLGNGALWGSYLDNYIFEVVALQSITILVHS